MRYAASAAILAAAVAAGCAEPATLAGAPAASQEESTRFPEAAALTAAFSAHVARVLGRTGGVELVPARGGFEGRFRSTSFAKLSMTFPADARDAAHVRAGDLDICVREEGVAGEGTIIERAIAYQRAGGTSFWTVNETGAEEWLHLSAGAVTSSEAAAAWHIEGAALEAHGDAVALRDAAGVARVWVTAPEAFATDGRPIGARLAVRGDRIELFVDAEGEEVLVDPAWTVAAPMLESRAGHAVQALPDGNAMAVGGAHQNTFLFSAELYDVATNTWKALPDMKAERYGASAFLLPSGKVLVAGGVALDGGILAAHLFNPAANTWTPGFNVAGGAFMATAVLPSGKILLAGGYDLNAYITNTWLYEPATNSWSFVAPMITGRDLAGAWTLPNGKVLVAGGFTGQPMNPVALASSEIYDPATDTWSPGPPMAAARAAFGFATLPNGKLIAAGGLDDTDAIAGVELFDPATNTWSAAAPLGTPRGFAANVLLPDGTFLVAAGETGSLAAPAYLATSELYYPGADTWVPAGSLSAGRFIMGATLLANGEALVTGGLEDQMGGTLVNADRYSAVPSNGAPCNDAAQCPSGFCTDNVCCVVAACPPPADQCHAQGSCTIGTGLCSDPARPDGTACDDGNTCTTADACQAGACAAGGQVDCKPQDDCHEAGTCDPANGQCDNPAKADGSPCPGGTCQGGACVPDMTGTGGAGGSAGAGGAGGAGAAGGAGGAGGGGPKDGGCGCRIADPDSGSLPASAVLLALGALLTAVRRRRPAPAEDRSDRALQLGLLQHLAEKDVVARES